MGSSATPTIALAAAMRASLAGYWRDAASYQKFLYSVGALLLASAAFHAVVLVATGGTMEGNVSWRKPILFGESFGLTTVTIAWVMTFLPCGRLPGWWLAAALGVSYLYEVGWVSFQQWRGVPSHFNSNSAFDQALFDTAGVFIGLSGLVLLTVALLSFLRLRATSSFAWAIRVGLLLLLAGQLFGLMIIRNDGPVFGTAGAMKVPHALALHGAQVLPLLAWLLSFTPWTESKRTRMVLTAVAGYILMLTVGAAQTFSGRAPLDLDAGPVILLALGALLFASAYGMGLLGLQPKAEPTR